MNTKDKTQTPGSARPEVIVEFLFERGLLFVAVRNIGSRAAHQVRISFSKKLVGPDRKRELSALPLFQRLQFLGPQREIRCFLDHSSSYFKRRQPTKISARVEYLDAERNSYEAKIDHDLEIYRGLPYLPQSCAEEE